MSKTVIRPDIDLNVPRYTSYPTAPHFTDAVDAGVYRRWLSELDPDHGISLYFHIPFCRSMCWFCGCHTKITSKYGPVSKYLGALLSEIDLVAAALGNDFRVQHVHFGGGSPTMIRAPDWRRLLAGIGSAFELQPNAEIAVEMDPRGTTEAYVKALARSGVNRVSLGVQSFDPIVQAAINRVQSYELTRQVIGWLVKHGITAYNLDLMYGLPHQSVAGVVELADQAAALGAKRIAVFGYAHVPWMRRHQRLIDETALPGGDARLAQYEAMSARLVEQGYQRIGLDHFARPGDGLTRALANHRLHRNFQGYTTDSSSSLIGFGASAIGSLPQGMVQNTQPIHAYQNALAGDVFATDRGIALAPEDSLRADIIERLMCYLKVDLDDICLKHGVDAESLEADLSRLAPLAKDGICAVDGHRIEIPQQFRPMVRLVAAAFDTYLDTGSGRHSRAV